MGGNDLRWSSIPSSGSRNTPNKASVLFFVQHAYLLPGVYVVFTIDNLWKYFPYELAL